MKVSTLQSGQSLLEILFAISIFVIGVVTIGYLTIDAFSSIQNVANRTEARLLASEGIEALISIRDSGFENVQPGTFGLGFENGFWSLLGTADETGKFTRTIYIEEIDSDLREVTSIVTWNVAGGQERRISYSTLISNWTQTNGAAGDLEVVTENASLISFDTELIGLFLRNTGSEDIVITDITLSWDTEAFLERVTIGGVDVLSATTSSPVISGTPIDISDFTLPADAGFVTIDSLAFDASITSSNVVIVFTLEDGTKRSVYVSL